MKWEFTKNCRYKLRIVLLTYTLLTLIPAKCKSQVKITRKRQTIGRELPNLLISEKKSIRFVLQRGRGGKVGSPYFFMISQSLIRGGRRGLAGRDCCLVLSSFTVAHCHVASPQTPLGFVCHECVTNEPQGTSAGRLTVMAKPTTSRQKQDDLTAKPKTSRQNRKPHSKTKNLTAKPNTVKYFVFTVRFLVLP